MTEYHNCKYRSRRKDFVVSVAIVQKPSRFAGIPFSLVAAEFHESSEATLTLLIVQLHRHSQLFPDVYYDRYQKHFTLMHNLGVHYNVGHPQKNVVALLHEARKTASPRAKLPPAYLDNPSTAFLVDSCVREYKERTMDFEGKPTLAEHFVWLSSELMLFCMDPRNPHIPPDFTLGLAKVEDWLSQVRESPWILDHTECPKPVLAIHLGPDSMGPGSADDSKKKEKEETLL